MAPAAPQLPTRFPCWCRAVYSWGGETKKDLGFIEGDLIECLNAGDGQWWMGRLRRDRRMAGLFPSNFVEVLGEDFVPKTRATSPMVQAGPSPIANPTSAPKKQKTVFRKPFQAHKEALAPSAELARNNTTTNASTSSVPQPPPRNGTLPRSVKSLRTPGASTSRQQSPLARPASRSRAASPQPPPPAPQELEPPVSSALVKHGSSRSGPLSRPVSPYAPYEQEIAPPAGSMRQEYSRPAPPLHSGSHYMLPEPEMPPEVPSRQIISQPMYKARSASPNPPYEPDVGPAVPLRHTNTFHSPSPTRPVSPYIAYNPDIPPPVPVRQGIPRSGPSPRPVSPAMSYEESDFPPPVPARQNFPQPVQQYRAVSPRPLSPRPVSSRAVSPRPVSPSVSYESDVPPPVPVRQHISLPRPVSREVSPLELQEEREDSPPPPPPPPHRVGVNRPPSRESRAPAPLDMNDRYVAISRTPSPAPSRSDVNEGNTPSPLRDAMEGVMTSLEDMEMSRGGPSPSPPAFKDPWSPDAYDDFKSDTKSSKTSDRPLTSMGFDRDGEKNHYNTVNGAMPHRNSVYTHDHYADGPPQINNYVQRMESRLRQLQKQNRRDSEDVQDSDGEESPLPPPKNVPYHGRHNSSPIKRSQSKARRTGRDLRDDILNRSFTNKSSTTNSSSGIQSNSTHMTSSTGRTSQSLMSGQSAGEFSATSAGSFRRRAKTGAERPNTSMDARTRDYERPETPLTGVSYHSSHNTSRQGASSAIPWSSTGDNNATPTSEEPSGVFGGLSTPKAKKQGFFKRIFDSAKTGAANARSSIAVGGGQNGGSYSPTKGRPVSPIRSPTRSPHFNKDTGRDGGGSSMDWVQVRRDVNRAVSPSPNERMEKAEKCQMLDRPVIYAVEEFYETAEGDESIDGLPISEPTNFSSGNLNLVDKSARFVNSLPPLTNPTSLAHGYVCRPYKSDVQRLRAIFTWVSEKIAWDEPVEELDVDLKRVLQTKRGCPQEVAYLVKEMCAAVGLYAEAIRGYLKTPGEFFDLDSLSRPNHWWNSVLVDGEWRAMDCSLANPTNPQRVQFASNSSPTAESWYFLARPTEICFTHVPVYPEEQHICPPISPDVLLALPAACPAYFKHEVKFPDYDTSILYVEGLEALQFRLLVPPDVELAAEVEAPSFARDADGDYFESGEIVRKRALVQPEWANGEKRYTVKAILPGDEGQGMVKVYAGKRGLMHSSRDIPHPVALAVPISHIGENPPYDFVLRHPTPHAQRHDLYIMQPQCVRLAINNTFVFAVRQHPASIQAPSTGNEQSTDGRVSPSPFARPASALSMLSSSVAGSSVSGVSNEFSASTSAISSRSGSSREKPAKLAIQSPSGKILRLSRKADHMLGNSSGTESSVDAPADGSVWETVIKIGERGTWRGLVLADRVARWCVFSEWECS